MSDSKTAEKMMKDWERALKKEKSLNQLHLRKKFKQLLCQLKAIGIILSKNSPK